LHASSKEKRLGNKRTGSFWFLSKMWDRGPLDKSIITISDNNLIEMHDLLQEMGRKVVHQESDEPKRGIRLCSVEEVYDTSKRLLQF